ncbi:unnamed protein product [Citrullus colocynthis]|uniref:Glycosyltransferase n=1 Tax=Citrullus colocynthis TaxID=252529 RepID=A0ABP0YJB6_9ROSI
MSKSVADKPHAVCIPFPEQGHTLPLLQLAKLLHSTGFHITFVIPEFYHDHIRQSHGPNVVKGLSDFQFRTIPDGLPPSERKASPDVQTLCDSTRRNFFDPFKQLVAGLNSSVEVPSVTCIIADGVLSFAIKAAEELGIPESQFWTASACSFMGYLHFDELIRRGILPFKDETFLSDGTLDASVDWIPGMKNIRLRDLPSFIRTTNIDDTMFDFMGSEARNCMRSSAIIFNTFDELENDVLEAISAKFPQIYTVGPLSLLSREATESHLKPLRLSVWKEDQQCLEWLDTQAPKSVVYVSFGCLTTMTDQKLREFAWGLAESKHPFLWVLRPDMIMGDSAILPEDFLEETKKRGFLTSWCPQEQVLAHPSVGAFLTHCGWNSTLEGLCGGVPFICWPFFADQQPNTRYACINWGIGLELNDDIKCTDLIAILKEIMEGDKGKELRQNAVEWKRRADKAAAVDGSSYSNFNRLIKEHFQAS